MTKAKYPCHLKEASHAVEHTSLTPDQIQIYARRAVYVKRPPRRTFTTLAVTTQP